MCSKQSKIQCHIIKETLYGMILWLCEDCFKASKHFEDFRIQQLNRLDENDIKKND
tara:strand:+ start:133 stop:300 length:168 start_codon:yes stop_codon:yes gene_type:complete